MLIKVFRIVIIAVVLISVIKYVNAASISEVLPNTENDTLLEYISLKNVSCVSEDISGYSLSDASGKAFVLPSNSFLGPGSLLSYYRSETKISLNNENESLFLRDSTGQLVDTFSYVTSVKWVPITQNVQISNCSIPSETTSSSGGISGETPVNNSGNPSSSASENTSDPSSTSGEVPTENPAQTGSVEWSPIQQSGSIIQTSSGVLANSSSGSSLSGVIYSSGSSSGSTQLLDSMTLSGVISSSDANSSSGGISLSSGGNSSTSTGSEIYSSGSGINTGNTSSSQNSSSVSPVAHIHIQSGLDSEMRCYKEDCSVNLEYPSPKSGEKCTWDFWGGEIDAENISKCNPTYAHYGYGAYQVQLRVCDALGKCSTDSIAFRIVDQSVWSATSSSTSSSPNSSGAISTASTFSGAASWSDVITSIIASWSIQASKTGVNSSTKNDIKEGLLSTKYPPKILFVPDSKGEVTQNGEIFALCDSKSKKPCKLSVTANLFNESDWKWYDTRWVLPNGVKRYTKSLKSITPSLGGETYIFELYSRETGNSFRFSLLIKKRFVTEEIVETENSESLYLAGATASGSGTKTVKKTKTSTKKASTVTKASATKKTKTSGSGASSETKTSSGANKAVTKWKTGEETSDAENGKILLLFAASILSFGIGLSISRLFLPVKRKCISSIGSEENS